MPIYEYRCPECGTVFSERRRMSEADGPVECPSCASQAPSRILSLFAAHSSGGGMIAGTGGGCSGCAATSCSTCKAN
ncbi:MAG: zinc ribbon domain-containing protein [Anaerolineae bacterium]|nr:zinc ribbon domain-containing protein [Anaerolineae bacterium]